MIVCFDPCGNSLGKTPCLFQNDCDPRHKARSLKILFECDVSELE